MRKSGGFVNLSCFVERFATAFLLSLYRGERVEKNAPPSQVVRFGDFGVTK